MREHHLLDRARDHPARTAIGAGAFTFYVVLHFAASNDLLAKTFLVSVSAVTWAFRILVVTLPVLVGAITYAWLSAVHRSEAEGVLRVPLAAFVPVEPPPTDDEGEHVEPPPGHGLYDPRSTAP